MSNKPVRSAYDISNELLVEALRSATIAAVKADTSTAIDSIIHMNYISGVMLARLENIRPPVDKTDVVRFKAPRDRTGAKERTVERVYYYGNGHWEVSLVNEEGRFSAELSELVPSRN